MCENDFLPKVVCSQCLRSLEECYVFRKECVSSESMLSSYFKNFRYTEDFKKSGKVYIKDTSTKSVSNETVSSTTTAANFISGEKHETEIKSANKQQQQQQQQPVSTYSINPLNLAANFKNVPKHVVTEALGNLAVNTNNEIINIAQLVDLEAFVCQPQKKQKQRKEDTAGVIKIQVTPTNHEFNEFDLNQQLKLPPQPHKQINKFTAFDTNKNQSVLINPSTVGDINQNQMSLYTTTGTTQIINQQQTTNSVLATNCNNYQQIVETNTRNNYHMPTKHYVETATSDEFLVKQQLNNNNNNKSHICDICRKTFKRREHLYQHIKLHTGFRPFTCESCNKSFMRKEHLLRHMTSHSGQKNFTCNICEKSFSRNDNLLKHRKTHEKQNSFTCDVCQKQFVMKHYYVAHKMTHDTNEINKCIGNTSSTSWGLLKV